MTSDVSTTRSNRDSEVDAADELGNLVQLREVAETPSVERAVEAVREFLDMDVAYSSEFVEDRQVFRAVRGEGASFEVGSGESLELAHTYCERVLGGRLPNLIPDARADDRAASLPITAARDIRAFVSVPLRFSDGRLYGTLCAASHRPKPALGYRELQFLHVFARLISDQLELELLTRRTRGLEVQAAAAETLVAAVQARDSYTGEHSRDVVAHAGAVARRLGLRDEEILDVERVALLHDIGKIGVPDAILGKPGSLTAQEWELMRLHPALGEQLICATPGLAHLAPAIRAEHERWDGRGYPDGLRGEEIPLASRITLVCDAYHAMVSTRPYRAARTPEFARSEIAAGSGTQFCPTSAEAFLAVADAGGPSAADAEAGSNADTGGVLVTTVTQPDLYKRVSDARSELLDLIGAVDAAAHERAQTAEPIRNELEDDLLLAANRLGHVAQRLLAQTNRHP